MTGLVPANPRAGGYRYPAGAVAISDGGQRDSVPAARDTGVTAPDAAR
jgi:hypothetical protein